MLPLLVVTTMLKIDMMLYIISMIKLPYYTMQINLATFIIQYHTGHCFFLQINQVRHYFFLQNSCKLTLVAK